MCRDLQLIYITDHQEGEDGKENDVFSTKEKLKTLFIFAALACSSSVGRCQLFHLLDLIFL